jgi:hypothetical protein
MATGLPPLPAKNGVDMWPKADSNLRRPHGARVRLLSRRPPSVRAVR